ncbi:MAG: 4Fe-4S dicluster domain-containing protein [Alphaproteobacteria bacterium]
MADEKQTPETPKVGVYVCHCGTNIGGTVDVASVTKFAASLPNVVTAREYKYTCSDPGQAMIRDDIKELGLNRIVVAACSPRMHEPTFRATLRDAGLNPYLLAVANIREHVSWVHTDMTTGTAKAKHLVAAAVSRVVLQESLTETTVPIEPAALVVGGGVAGIQVALDIAGAGFKVVLVEREPTIGGHMAQLDKTFPTLDCSACILTPKMVDVARHPNIELISYAQVEHIDGYIGNFQVKIRKKARYVHEDICTGCQACLDACVLKGRIPAEFEFGMGKRSAIYIPFPQAVPLRAVVDPERCLTLIGKKCKQPCVDACGPGAIDFEQKEEVMERKVGTIVLATGFKAFDPARQPQYGYGRYDNVLTALQFERLCNASGPTGGKIVKADGDTPKRVAFIHCIGSRDEATNKYCSRVCCMYSLKLAHLAKEKTGGEVYNFYIDIRSAGKGYEEFYDRMGEEGIRFIRGKVAEVLPENGRLRLLAENTLLGRPMTLDVDMVVLATGLEPQPDTVKLAQTFHISRSADGFLLEGHPKLRPVSTNTGGVFLAGCCQGPKDIPDSVAQASGAASQAIVLMNQGEVAIEPITAFVVEERCSGCGDCLVACPYEAISRNERGKAEVNTALCKGCGSCAATCLAQAILTQHFTGDQLVMEMVGALRSFAETEDVLG